MDCRKRVKICNERGLHARASAKFVKLAAAYDADVVVKRDDMEANGCSIMSLMMLAASKGTEIEISASGKQAEDAVNALASLVGCAFDEE